MFSICDKKFSQYPLRNFKTSPFVPKQRNIAFPLLGTSKKPIAVKAPITNEKATNTIMTVFKNLNALKDLSSLNLFVSILNKFPSIKNGVKLIHTTLTSAFIFPYEALVRNKAKLINETQKDKII